MINPFQGLSGLQKSKLLRKLESHTYQFNKNEEIIPTLKNTNIICIILEGSAKIINTNYLGEETLVEELYENSIFGTNMSNIGNTETRIIATEFCEVLIIDYYKLIKQENLIYPYYDVFVFNLLQIFHEKLRQNNNRIQIHLCDFYKGIQNLLFPHLNNYYIFLYLNLYPYLLTFIYIEP